MGNGGQMLVASDWWLVNPSPQPNQGRLMKSHKELNVWKDATDLAENIYQLTSKYPKVEMFWISSQLRRAAVSIPSNIAEGSARGSRKEYIRFLYIAAGSASELETQLELSIRTTMGERSKIVKLQEKTTIILKML